MAPPNITLLRVEAVHAALLAATGPKKKVIPRRRFDEILAKLAPKWGPDTRERIVREGKIRGCWLVPAVGANRGALVVLDPKTRAPDALDEDVAQLQAEAASPTSSAEASPAPA